MKRSEMIFWLKKCYDPYIEGIDEPTLLSIAEHILEGLEVLGMTPPIYLGLIANGKKYNNETDFSRDTAFFREWEPEDE